MPPGIIDYNHEYKHTTQQQDNFIQSVKNQEAQFEKLTRELEAERQKVAHKVQQYRIGSETESMNSISSTDDTFQWGGPQDDSLRYANESHGLMDSCLQELENRGTMNFGEDNMNYMPEDPYHSSGPGPYHSYNGGPHHDINNSIHSSHASLHSNGSNKHNARQVSVQGLAPTGPYHSYNGGPHHDINNSIHSSHASLHSNGSNRHNARQVSVQGLAPTGPYHSYNGGPHHDINNSIHSSHASLHSNGSNRHNARQVSVQGLAPTGPYHSYNGGPHHDINNSIHSSHASLHSNGSNKHNARQVSVQGLAPTGPYHSYNGGPHHDINNSIHSSHASLHSNGSNKHNARQVSVQGLAPTGPYHSYNGGPHHDINNSIHSSHASLHSNGSNRHNARQVSVQGLAPTGPYHSYNGGPHHDINNSIHSSHASLHSNGSNRHNARQVSVQGLAPTGPYHSYNGGPHHDINNSIHSSHASLHSNGSNRHNARQVSVQGLAPTGPYHSYNGGPHHDINNSIHSSHASLHSNGSNRHNARQVSVQGLAPTGPYHSYNGGPHHDINNSIHSSHASLHSNGSNRHNARQMKLSNQHLVGSHSSLPHEQQHPSDNYAPYSSLPQRNYDDYRGSPLPSNGSPRGPGTPTRFTNNYDGYGGYNRGASPLTLENNVSYGGPVDQDSLDNPMQQQHPHLDTSYQYDSYRGGPPDDRYPPPDDRYPNQVEDSFYRQSPVPDPRYPQDRYKRGQDPGDNYMDHPGDGYRDDDSYRGHPDNSFQGQPDFNEPQPVDRYGQPIMDEYQGPPSNHHPDMRYGGEPLDDSYRGQPEDGYRGQPDDSFRGPQDDSFRNQPPNDNRYGDYDDDGYRQDGYRDDDRYNDQPTSGSFQHDPHGNGYPDDMLPNYNDDSYIQENRRHDGLPQVQADPFANDPFTMAERQRSLQHLRDEENYPREPSPRDEGPGNYMDRPPQYDHMDGQPSYGEDGNPDIPRQYYDDDMVVPQDGHMLRAPPDDYIDDGRRTPSIQGGTMRYRAPDLQEVIDYLSSPSHAVKANAAAYLTHICFNEDENKQKVGALHGIPPLVELLNSEYPEVHRNACGALKNLTFGRNNRDNKKALIDARGVPALVRLLRKTQDDDVKDCVTGVLWNLSSVDKFKKPIIDDGLAVLVNTIIIPYSGWERRGLSPYQIQEPWSLIFRNASGVLRNVSSAGPEARKKLRECHGLVESFIYVIRTGIDQNNFENKSVENCTCTLRNLAFRIQEVENPDFFKTRNATLQRQKQPDKGEKVGCFGGGGKKKPQKNKADVDQMPEPTLPPTANEYMGIWAVDTVRFLLTLLTGSNNVTLEASCGAIQNLTACDWKPAVSIRALVRKEKGLPSLVDLLTHDKERVVCAAAIALRNLSIDDRNKELVGKYAMKQLISNLPQDNRPNDLQNETISAVLACLNEVLGSNPDYASTFMADGGLPRLFTITKNQHRYDKRTVKFAVTVLKTLWSHKVLRQTYQNQFGLSEKDFHPNVLPKDGQQNSNFSTPYNTISRPMQGQGYDDTTLSSRKLQSYPSGGYNGDPRMVQGHSNPLIHDSRENIMYGSKQDRIDAIPMNDIGPGYAPIDEQRNHRNKPPVGGVALFPNLPPDELSNMVRKKSLERKKSEEASGQQPGGGSPTQEPLYARVNKKRGQGEMGSNPVMLGQDQGQEGADSWV